MFSTTSSEIQVKLILFRINNIEQSNAEVTISQRAKPIENFKTPIPEQNQAFKRCYFQ